MSLLTATVAEAREFVSIKGKTVNVREQPNTRSATLWELGSGYPLQVQQRKGQWLKVRDYEATLGWVHAPLTNKTPHRIVTARSANLRATPSGNGKIVSKLPRHEVVQTVKNSGTWVQVRTESGKQGWVAKNLTWGW
ncbi:SH3 domain-containing protein [Diaphorobacter sp. HDW4A]|uniref:SH3 domain-containing protein n=1 Tax=Diaphorobacter sp. HDW4A TaxID=2714924 RepID=UPI0014092513|nr:SH3 domain-containing protein [Diaphorobacter sp. HDW4A]QIL83844.1 SH3 domain-containing protein [Diaphorobacter sp. HDW4A]